MNNNNMITTSSDAIQSRRRMVRNYSLLCLDECLDEAKEEYQSILTQLRANTDNVNIFKQRDECIDFLTDGQEYIKCFLVVKDIVSQEIMPLINNIPQMHGIYIFSDTKILSQTLIEKWQKIKSVHANINDLCQELQLGIKRHSQDSIAVSFVPVNEIGSTDNLNQLEPTFMYTQLFKEILLDMKYNSENIKGFITYCRQSNSGSLVNINLFEKEYQAQSAISWYTRPSFIYSMLNDGLRFMESDTIISMGFLIHDLHLQIHKLHQEQINIYHGEPFVVYRGQGLSKQKFEKLQNTKGGLISFNNFLSTSMKQDVALEYAFSATDNADNVGVLFIMSIDPCIKSSPFASIENESHFKDEGEILFSMHTVFRVGTIKQMDNNNQLYQVELQLTPDDDQQLRLLTNRIREESIGATGWQRLGDLLLKIGQFNTAEELYNQLLKQTCDDHEKAGYHHKLGCVKDDQGDHENAIWYYQKALEIFQKSLPSNHPNLVTSYNGIGNQFAKLGQYSKALSYYEKAHEIKQNTLPSNHHDLVISYNNIGNVYNKMEQYSKALSSHEKAVEIFQKSLPSNHPDLAASYNNIGSVYSKTGEYSKAVIYYEKALEIFQNTLPSNHPNLAGSYNNIGSVYNEMGENSKALSYYETALEIRQKSLPSNHHDLATSYGSVGYVYANMGDYSKALSYYEKALEIEQKSLPSNHHDLATTYNNIGNVYNKMEQYSKALSSHDKAHEIFQKTLPSNHPDLASSYNNTGNVYSKMEQYSKALSYYEKALEIRQKSLHSNHHHLATSYDSVGYVYANMGDYSKALSYYEKAHEIFQKTLPSNHPDLASSYNNIGSVYNNMTDYSKALSYFERALDINQYALPPTHPHIKIMKENIEIVKKKL
ncbi:unnamed protein product [Adineta steineri]|uniref:NAD(P)(+)--arginine ADP-ribosyltransferase n=2 Tax=Adineta steineri TaxID=433720 RepID=A0A818GBK2_9BILA|nr:unnamed protein product [Adineta steineri]